MFIALNKENIKVDVIDANKDEEYFCPICSGKLRIKDGEINAKHFAHISLQDCDDFTHDMSEWHRKWQEQFPLKNREVVIEHNGEKHRADVLACGCVIEFQHSPISAEEFNRRNEFYTNAGKKVIWIFDFIDQRNAKHLTCNREWSSANDNGGCWLWNYHKKCFNSFIPQRQKNIILFFQMEDADFTDEDQFFMERVVKVHTHMFYNSECIEWKWFDTSYYPGNKTELLDWIKNDRFNNISEHSLNINMKALENKKALERAREISLNEEIKINDLCARLVQEGFDIKSAWYGSRLGGMCTDNSTIGYYIGNDLSIIETEDADYLASWFCKNYNGLSCRYEDVVSVFQWWFNKWNFCKASKKCMQSMIELAYESKICY